MELSSISDGFHEPYVLSWPPGSEMVPDELLHGLCMVVMKRPGGLLLAVPTGFIPLETLQTASLEAGDSLLGPHTVLTVPGVSMVEEVPVPLGADIEVLVVDVGDEVQSSLTLFSASDVEEGRLVGFAEDRAVLPQADQLMAFAQEWIAVANSSKTAFYSAEEVQETEVTLPLLPKTKAKAKAPEKARASEKAKKPSPQLVAEHILNLSKMMPAMQTQLQAIQQQQEVLQQAVVSQSMSPPTRARQVSISMPMQNFAKIVGSPPRVKGAPAVAMTSTPKAPPLPQGALDSSLTLQEQAEEESPIGGRGDALALAVLEQSKALTSLVAQLQQGGDPLLDAQHLPSGSSSRGAAGRERLQKELGGRSGGFFLQVLLNAYRRMKPAAVLPQSLEELSQTDFSLCQYLERYGGYGQARELGLIQYMLSFVADAAMKGEMEGVREHLALTLVAIEQASQDNGRWELAYQLCLLEDPPSTIFSYRSTSAMAATTGRVKAFSPLCPQKWATIALAYTKEIDYIQSRRTEASKSSTAPPLQPPLPSPKKRGKFPKSSAPSRCLTRHDDFHTPLPSSSSSVRASRERSTVSFGRGEKASGGEVLEQESLNGEEEEEALSGESLRSLDDKKFNGFMKKKVSMHAWVNGVLRNILKGKTQFGFYVLNSIHSCRKSRLSPASAALFPIPMPFEGIWDLGPKRLGPERRFRLAVQRATSLVIIALNFLSSATPFRNFELIRRCPNLGHRQVVSRIAAFIRASGPSSVFSILGCGRKSFQLDAGFRELHQALQGLGLGVQGSYHGGPAEEEIEKLVDAEELIPYRTLDASRLKLSGKGQWNAGPYMSDLLYMPYMEPRINQFSLVPPSSLLPDLSKVDPQEVLSLARVWDARGLLRIFPAGFGPSEEWAKCKVFNCYKDHSKERQIGDRRGMNMVEGKIAGPSKTLPSATSILQMHPVRYQEAVVGSVADRRDFYHQFMISDEKAAFNAMHPSFRLEQLEGLHALEKFHEDFGTRRRQRKREARGDFLAGRPRPILINENTEVNLCFGALFQGDHLGVEFATDSHIAVLKTGGLLQTGSRFSAEEAIVFDQVCDGLVIDDYFVLGIEKAAHDDCYPESKSLDKLQIAKGIYEAENLIGSDDKDVISAHTFKVCGAEVNSSFESVRRGLVSVGSPFEKRMILAYLSSLVAAGRWTSDSLHLSLVGSWVSAMMMRRPAMSVLDASFHVVDESVYDSQKTHLIAFPKAAAQEFQLLACLAPILASNIAVPFCPKVYSTDASMVKGGITESEFPIETIEVAWRTADRKGENVPMLRLPTAVLAQHDTMFEELPKKAGFCVGPEERHLGASFGDETSEAESIPRPIGLRFQFLELCGGAGVVTKELVILGAVCGPVIDLSFSAQYNMADLRVIQWTIFMLESDRLDSFLMAPPCTTFSAAAHPAIRSYKEPRGFDQSDERTLLGNQLAFAMLVLIFVALRLRKPALGEQPRRSKMRWLREWQRLLTLGARECHLASCSFGSPHQKEFVFLSSNMNTSSIAKKCSRDHSHVKIEGALTKPSATYTRGLAIALARLFKQHLDFHEEVKVRQSLDISGLEDALTDELCLSGSWSVTSSWRWSSSRHINVFETAAIARLYEKLAEEGGDCRVVFLCDSHVARSVVARGRSSSRSLKYIMRRIGALALAFGIYGAGRFAPTRWNSADHPTRDAMIPPAVPWSIVDFEDPLQVHALARLRGLKRWAANWTRLAILLAPGILDFVIEPSAFRRYSSNLPGSSSHWSFDFDSTLGFPGEGLPLTLLSVLTCSCLDFLLPWPQ